MKTMQLDISPRRPVILLQDIGIICLQKNVIWYLAHTLLRLIHLYWQLTVNWFNGLHQFAIARQVPTLHVVLCQITAELYQIIQNILSILALFMAKANRLNGVADHSGQQDSLAHQFESLGRFRGCLANAVAYVFYFIPWWLSDTI